MTHDFTRASVRDPSSSAPPAYMSSLQSGYEELGAERLERLQQDINNIKNNYKRANVSDGNEEHGNTVVLFILFYYIPFYLAKIRSGVIITFILI